MAATVLIASEALTANGTGTIIAVTTHTIEVEFEELPAAAIDAEVVVLAGSARRHREHATARWRGAVDRRATLHLSSAWRPFDMRAAPRLEADLNAKFYFPVTLTDVSTGGLGVELDLRAGNSASSQ